MKKEFGWYFPLSESEIDYIWKNGILTVDANVLLDLYRYHESTRNSLIASLKEFEGRLWLSNQAAEEFFRNRTNVIISSGTTFKKAEDEVKKLKDSLESTISQLKGNRIISTEVTDELTNVINPAIENALVKIHDLKSSYPNFLRNDPILENLVDMFEDSIGEECNRPCAPSPEYPEAR